MTAIKKVRKCMSLYVCLCLFKKMCYNHHQINSVWNGDEMFVDSEGKVQSHLLEILMCLRLLFECACVRVWWWGKEFQAIVWCIHHNNAAFDYTTNHTIVLVVVIPFANIAWAWARHDSIQWSFECFTMFISESY